MKDMKRSFKCEAGFTLIEVLVSTLVVASLVLAGAKTITDSQYLNSLSRHKVQAMYAAQQILEQKRRATFVAASSVVTAPVVLDTYGNFSNTNGYFYGTSVTTVTNLDAYRNQVTVEVSWPEQVLAAKRTTREYFSTNIANDPIPN